MSFATHSTATAASYTAGFKASLPNEAFIMGPSPGGSRYRGITIELASEGAGDTVGGNVWCFWPAMNKATGRVEGYMAQCITILSGTTDAGVTYPSGHVRSLAAYGCDAMTVTTTTTATSPKGPGATINTALGGAGAQAFSPNDDATPAYAIIPDCGNPSHIYVETWESSGAATNAYIEGIV